MHSKSYRYGVWGATKDATVVFCQHELKDMLRDIMRTIRGKNTEQFNIMVQAAGLSVEEVHVTHKILNEVTATLTEDFRVNFGELKKSLKGSQHERA